ncbi:MAG: NAAT family transporter [Chlamydiales bacterium]|nr:NAAT family transporter [Chlamydiales bacterium]
MSLFAVVLSLFFVLNALGNIPLFLGLIGRYDVKRQRKIILREFLIALFILLLFNFCGNTILDLLGISEPIIGIAGGILLFIIALGMIFPKDEKHERPRQEPLIVPLAIPLVAGPGSIATVMVYSENFGSVWLMSVAIILAWLPCLLLVLASSNIKHLLGERGLSACERLGGMLISLVAVQMFASGSIKFVLKTCSSAAS